MGVEEIMIRDIINKLELSGWLGRRVRWIDMVVMSHISGMTVGVSVVPDGVCNLKCPSCPVGNSKFGKSPHMSMDTFRKVLDKLQKEVKFRCLALSCYSEPLLFDDYYKYVEELTKRGIKSFIPTNLNIMPAKKLFDAGLSDLRISVSGFNGDCYNRHHVGGDVEVVKRNMKDLVKIVGNTSVMVHYHRYEDNLSDLPLMKRYAEGLGFEFSSCKAYYRPAEKAIYPDGVYADSGYLSTVDPSHYNISCRSHYKQLLIMSDCRVRVCCHVIGEEYFLPDVNYLTTPIKEIRRKQKQMEICVDCKSLGYHVLYNDNRLEK